MTRQSELSKTKRKNELRTGLLRDLKGLVLKKKNDLDAAITQNLRLFLKNSLKDLNPFNAIGFFSPLKSEPEWDVVGKVSLLLAENGIKTAYPAFIDGEMRFLEATRGELTLGEEFGKPIFRPAVTCSIVNPEILIIPGLGFNLEGKRLGRGKGHYDRYLSTHPEVLKVGIAFEFQIVKELPWEEHDVAMNYLITEKNIYKF